MEFDTQVKLAIYEHFAETGGRPGPRVVAARVLSDMASVLEAYQRLAAQRLLVLEKGGSAIQMAPPFSGLYSHHVVESEGVSIKPPEFLLNKCEPLLHRNTTPLLYNPI